MTLITLIRQARADGVGLTLSDSGDLKATGIQQALRRWLPMLREHQAGIVATLQGTTTDKDAAAFRWLIHYSDRPAIEVTFSPAVNHNGALTAFPAAISVEPVFKTPGRYLSLQEAEELATFVRIIYQNDSEADRLEALAAALEDPDNALVCYRSLVGLKMEE